MCVTGELGRQLFVRILRIEVARHLHRPRERLRIVVGHHEGDQLVGDDGEALRDVQLPAVRREGVADAVVRAPIEIGRVGDERVAFPMGGGMSAEEDHVRRRMRTPVEIEDARLMVLLEEHRDFLSRLLEDRHATAGPRLRRRAAHAQLEVVEVLDGAAHVLRVVHALGARLGRVGELAIRGVDDPLRRPRVRHELRRLRLGLAALGARGDEPLPEALRL
ncbi:MAG: hypothetical protein DMF88_17090 [Acidobacteria bacterium]|nr:MAG: hypothetical protein DMF88_17090 [Acidobacteriota bacterium]